MRRAWLPFAALALSAAVPIPTGTWVLRSDGLSRTVAGKTLALRFGTMRKVATATVASVLGKPVESHTAPDCGQGDPMVLVTYRNGLTMQFLKGKFSGWSIEAPADPALRTDKGITLGATRAAVMKAYPDVEIDDGSLGVMFTSEAGPSGFLDSMKPNARVTGLYAGETCLIS